MGAFKFAKTVLGSLFDKPATLMYPVVPREWQERTRGAIDIDKETCILCGICSRKCPTKAITVDRKAGFWEIQRMQCIQCGECVAECPKDSLIMNPKYTEPNPEKVIDTVEIEVKKPAPKADATADVKAEDKAEAQAAPAGDDDNLVCDKDVCIFCGLCAKACPVEALKVDRKEKVWEVDLDACVKCGACIDKCPKKCLSFGEKPAEEKAEAAEPAKAQYPELKEDDCIYCRACENACPSEAIVADMDDWKLDKDKCVGCAACVDVCPADALEMK